MISQYKRDPRYGSEHSIKRPDLTVAPTKSALKNNSSVADPDPGSRAFLTPGSGIRNSFSSESLILKPIFLTAYNSLKIGPNYFLEHFKNKIIVNFVATKNGMTTNFFHPSL
jgi:hypothetical protein